MKVASFWRIGDFVARPVQNVKEQRLQDLRRVAPACKVEGLETAERERVLGVVEQESVLPLPRPAMQPILQLADDVGEVRDRALLRFENVNPLDSVPELALFLVVQSVALIVALDQSPEESKQELQVLFCRVEARTD